MLADPVVVNFFTFDLCSFNWIYIEIKQEVANITMVLQGTRKWIFPAEKLHKPKDSGSSPGQCIFLKFIQSTYIYRRDRNCFWISYQVTPKFSKFDYF